MDRVHGGGTGEDHGVRLLNTGELEACSRWQGGNMRAFVRNRRVLTTFAATVGLASSALAQDDAGPPPAMAEKVPTLAEAKEFVERMVSQHAMFRCEGRHTSGTSNWTEEYLVKLDGGTITVDQLSKNDTEDRGRSYNFRMMTKSSAPIEEGSISHQTALQGTCLYPYVVNFHCSNKCVKMIRTTHGEFSNGDPRDDDETAVVQLIRIPFDDGGIAMRVVNALKFYQANQPKRKEAF